MTIKQHNGTLLTGVQYHDHVLNSALIPIGPTLSNVRV